MDLKELPEPMKIKAKWAREQILKYPNKVEIDEDELLAWIYNEEDDLWYSIDGNYSKKSPKEKMEQRKIYKEKKEQWEKNIENVSIKRYVEQQYWSKVRNNILKRDNWTCQRCNKQINKLDIHHIIKRNEIRIDTDDNLITVCRKCHKKLDREYGEYKNEI